MKKKPKTVAALCLLTFCLTGCFPTGKLESGDSEEKSPSTVSSGTNENSSDVQQESSVPVELDNVKFTMDTSFEYPAEAPVIKCKRRKFDVEQAKALFIPGKTIFKEDIREGLANLFTTDGSSLSINSLGITYVPDDHLFDGETEKRSTSLMQRSAAHNVGSESRYQFPHINDELEGFSRSEARKRADELIEMLEIKYLGEPEIFALTAEDCHNYDENIVLSKDEECYFLRYYSTYNGIPIPIESREILKDGTQEGSYVDVILTKDKIVKFVTYNIFDDMEEISSLQIKCSPDTALRKLHDYFGMKGQTYFLIEYDNLDLVYITSDANSKMSEYTYKPLWRASGKKLSIGEGADADEKPYTTCKYVDTATGTVFDTRD